MAELDAFWSAIPPERHRAWSQRAQHVIIDGSPQVLPHLAGHIYIQMSGYIYASDVCVADMHRATVCADSGKFIGRFRCVGAAQKAAQSRPSSPVSDRWFLASLPADLHLFDVCNTLQLDNSLVFQQQQ